MNNAIQANDFPRHLKAGDLVATVLGGDTGFEKSGANGVERGEIFTVLKQHVATLDLAPGGDHLFNALHLLAVQAHGHAQFAQIAIGAGNLYGCSGRSH